MIHDIKPLEQISDYLFFLYQILGVIGFALAVVLVLFFLRMKKRDPKKEALTKLRALELNDAKKDAYLISKLARQLLVDEQIEQKFLALEDMLARYKYKKNVDAFDAQIKKEFALFLELVSARI
jgi:C-terminal processing protease CtpA/Prc